MHYLHYKDWNTIVGRFVTSPFKTRTTFTVSSRTSLFVRAPIEEYGIWDQLKVDGRKEFKILKSNLLNNDRVEEFWYFFFGNSMQLRIR